MSRIAVIYYSMTGNVARLARAVAHGATEVGADVRLRRVPELIPEDRLTQAAREAREQQRDVPLAHLDDLRWCDGAAFGSPTRYGNTSSQLKNFIDQTGELWVSGELVGKAASVFTSTQTQHGGQETTLVTMMLPLFHLGFVVVGLPYVEQLQSEVVYIHGGSPYGASSISGPHAARTPTDNDLALAEALGRRLAQTAERLRGRHASDTP